MAVFNERATIGTIVARVLQQACVHEVIIVDDGSEDGTRGQLQALAVGEPRIRLVFHERNQGKGAAIRRAIAMADGEVCIIQDADLEYDPRDYEGLLAPIHQGVSRVVYGSRVINPRNRYPLDRYRIGSYVVTETTNLLYGTRLTDEPTCYKAFDTRLLKSLPLRATGFEFCPEVTALVAKRGEKIVEVPIRYQKRSVAEGKKIRWHDGAIALWTLVRLRLAP